MNTRERDIRPEPENKVVIVGAGGNIGSHLVSHVARMAGVGSLTLIDPGRYEEKNLSSQEITANDVGSLKSCVQAERLKKVRPGLLVRPFCDPVEAVPWGEIRGDILLSCPDSLAARLYVNQVAWRLGMPWIDAGVRNDGLLARVTSYRPGYRRPCLECSLDQQDYGNAADTDSCLGEDQPLPTDAPSCLGALAASLQALECRRFLGDNEPLVTREVLIEARFHNHYLTTPLRNPSCRFDHQKWDVESIEIALADTSVEEFCRGLRPPNGEILALSVAGQSLASCVACTECGTLRRLLFIRSRVTESERCCPACGETMIPPALSLHENLLFSQTDKARPEVSLAEMGLRHRDIVELEGSDGRLTVFEISDARSSEHDLPLEEPLS